MSEFMEAFERAVGRPPGRATGRSPWDYVSLWDEFVTECESGYSSGIYEYDDELSVRDAIERAVRDPAVGGTADGARFLAAVSGIDDRFSRLLSHGLMVRPDAEHWWLQKLPAFGGDDMVADALRVFGVQVRLCD